MTITQNIKTIQRLIANAEKKFNRAIGSVRLLAVSKQHSPEAINEAFQAGLSDFGENYLQEALIKINQLSHLSINWHFIGSIQRNKTKAIANHFSWVHTVSTRTIAERLNDARPVNMPPLNVCIQLNLDEEKTKGGISFMEATDLAAYISTLPRLALRGLMILPKPITDVEQQYASFLRITHCLQELNHRLQLSMDTLSMGMSHDFEAAIRAGSTIVRIGTAIFGKR